MGDCPEYEATRGSYWRALIRRRRIGIIAAAAVLVLGITGAVALRVAAPPERPTHGETTRTITPASPASETSAAVPAYEATATAGEDAVDGVAVPPVTPVAPVTGRAPFVAYRREGWLCVAAEDGTGERRVAESASGVFALSPDGTLLAYVDSGAGSLGLVEAATGRRIVVGPALQHPPAWGADSGWLAYTAPGPIVQRVRRDGTGATVLFAGSMSAVSVDGASVVGMAASGELAVWRGGSLSRRSVTGAITGLACDGASVLYGSIAPQTGAASLRAVGLDGSGDRVLVSAPAALRAVTFGDLLISPDGCWLAYAEHSDDGYSRMFAVPTAGGAPVSLCVRRDCYPLKWTADGTSVIFIEGNAFQGDPTALMRVTPMGGARRLLVQGAGR